MKLIIGLGNPGQEYENTRHNLGFKVIDAFASKNNIELNKKKFNGLFYKGDDFVLAKPLTYMNLSGEFVSKIAHYFKIELKDILIIYDDLDLHVGQIRFREKGSHGGHNGIKNIIEEMGTHAIPRLKIGIGRPHNGIKNYVLGKFSKIQIQTIREKKEEIIAKVEEFINK